MSPRSDFGRLARFVLDPAPRLEFGLSGATISTGLVVGLVVVGGGLGSAFGGAGETGACPVLAEVAGFDRALSFARARFVARRFPFSVEVTTTVLSGATATAATAATPDDADTEACFDGEGSLEAEMRAPEDSPISTLTGPRAGFVGAGLDGSRPWKTTSGKATAAVTSTSTLAAIMPARTVNNRQTPPGPITSIFLYKSYRDYPSIKGLVAG